VSGDIATPVPDAPFVPDLLHIDDLVRRERIIVCCGSGGVGKTTTSAALALRAAEAGRKVVVLTIDPAKRLAQSMGLEQLDNTPHRVPGVSGDGELWAMMLDMKSTFDELILEHNSPEQAEAILANPFYKSMSTNLSGTQEYMAMERLSQLHATGEWDLIVVDTPPSRSALDFLDAPSRMTGLLEGRMMKVILAPAKAAGRGGFKLLSSGVAIVSNLFARMFGAQFITDISAMFAAMEQMFGGFSERARTVYELLGTDGTAFVVVAAPESDALREASFFVERLREEDMPLAGLVVNRVHRSSVPTLSHERALVAAEDIEARDNGDALAASILRLHVQRVDRSTRERHLQQRFHDAHPNVAAVEVLAFDDDIHDLDGLRRIGEEIAAVHLA
jgi:anion-transporting  ArsA/GET3 family ATPase